MGAFLVYEWVGFLTISGFGGVSFGCMLFTSTICNAISVRLVYAYGVCVACRIIQRREAAGECGV